MTATQILQRPTPHEMDATVQAILVADDLGHLAAVHAAARASVLAQDAEPEAPGWDAWLSGPFVKSVRRTRRSRLDGLDAASGVLDIDGLVAAAYAPMPYSQLPKIVADARVAGTDFERDGTQVGTPDAPVVVEVLDTMTTGKAAAQAAHALWTWSMRRTGDQRAEWIRAGLPVVVRLQAAEALDSAAVRPGAAVIRDSGFTEVEPDTLTAVAVDA
jgi:peptidyl-tRNA hydrolase